ncbi:hypothetical protein GCM10011331_23680 [Flavimobilis marinus]|uniref:Matrixin n=2 Tax=Flavimobilis marinus TaxID=285351 RepID=A0A1I2GIN2_9MICO|nr:hypothetical protein GCM10011331_23680 [Flavimobilis marinus]SFF17445.1 Matrixin [Flavimobilis marinus]
MPEPDPIGDANRRRRRRARRLVTTLVSVTVVAVVGVGLALAPLGTFPWQREPWTPGVPWRTTSDAEAPVWTTSELELPSAGFEEQSSRLLPVPTVSEPSNAYRLQTVPEDFHGDDFVARWSPCRPIHYVVNTDGAPDDFVERVDGVVAQVSAATGLAFVDDGATTERPSDDRPSYQPERYGDRWAPVLIGFADESEISLLGEAIGAGTADYAYDADGTFWIASGSALLDVELLDERRLWGEPFYVSVLRHELGHVVGLDHINVNKQLMAPASPMIDFQAGDLTGLAELGQGPCAPDV